MNNVIILLDNLSDWKPYYETNSISSVSDYLKHRSSSKSTKLVLNLSNDYSYNSEGYYGSLLAQARGDNAFPSVKTINKLETGAGLRMDINLQKPDTIQVITPIITMMKQMIMMNSCGVQIL